VKNFNGFKYSIAITEAPVLRGEQSLLRKHLTIKANKIHLAKMK